MVEGITSSMGSDGDSTSMVIPKPTGVSVWTGAVAGTNSLDVIASSGSETITANIARSPPHAKSKSGSAC